MGLPGSGKSYYLKAHMKDFEGAKVLDDPSVQDIGPLEDLIAAHDSMVIADPMLCLISARAVADRLFEGWEKIWIFYENDFRACWDNVRFREDDRSISRFHLVTLSALYDIPKDAVTLPVYKP